jgi:3-deoxy-manno-octulosonate cytidylyltransferase (CMP-KDO synthetase)
MVEHVWRACQESLAFADVLVATDDERIRQAVGRFGGRAVLTSSTHATGTDRVAEVARAHPDVDVWVNVQGDEPLLDPRALETLVDTFRDPAVELATLVRPLLSDEADNPNVVKAVLALNGDALYFSRSPIPFERSAPAQRWAHVGLYGYRAVTLARLAALPPTPLELAESLEQLRALEHGVRIRCAPVSWNSIAVDVPEDVVKVEAALRARNS